MSDVPPLSSGQRSHAPVKPLPVRLSLDSLCRLLTRALFDAVTLPHLDTRWRTAAVSCASRWPGYTFITVYRNCSGSDRSGSGQRCAVSSGVLCPDGIWLRQVRATIAGWSDLGGFVLPSTGEQSPAKQGAHSCTRRFTLLAHSLFAVDFALCRHSMCACEAERAGIFLINV